jgi:carbon-monoxide dehydrogenase small subunit
MVARHVRFKINGRERDVVIDTRLLLVDAIRETFGLTGTQRCGLAGCSGACTVLVNDWPVFSCLMLAVSADRASIRTVEGFRCDDGDLHPLPRAFIEHCPSQCGHCTPGMLMSAMALLESNPRPTREDVRRGLAGNICRCTGYSNVIDAVMTAAQHMHAAREVNAR